MLYASFLHIVDPKLGHASAVGNDVRVMMKLYAAQKVSLELVYLLKYGIDTILCTIHICCTQCYLTFGTYKILERCNNL